MLVPRHAVVGVCGVGGALDGAWCGSEGIEADPSGQSWRVKEVDLDNIATNNLRPVRRDVLFHRKRRLIMSNEPYGWRSPARSGGRSKAQIDNARGESVRWR